MEVKYLACDENQSKRSNHPVPPQGITCLIIGKSGCGKTTLLINILLRPGWLDYNNINIFSKSLFQSEYHILNKVFEEKLQKQEIIRIFEKQNEITDLGFSTISIVEEIAKEITEKSYIERNSYQSAIYVPDPRELSSEKQNLTVFDDLLLEKQNTCESYYVRGRRRLFLFSPKLFQAPTSYNQGEREFHLSVFSRPGEP